MPNDKNIDISTYDKAREITEKALAAFKDNNEQKGNKLIDEAKRVNEKAVKDINEELEEDASSEHDPAKLNGDFDKTRDGSQESPHFD